MHQLWLSTSQPGNAEANRQDLAAHYTSSSGSGSWDNRLLVARSGGRQTSPAPRRMIRKCTTVCLGSICGGMLHGEKGHSLGAQAGRPVVVVVKGDLLPWSCFTYQPDGASALLSLPDV